ncbi:ankyrin repeat domain-containing protein [Hydrogenophaga sp. BPS33]|uniref:ankyrin repeat domain-containing protein n=1 Tax=Hydrogenophaga sp. BPS33 TaxID=2651974 RepID=UPI00131FB71D|nr:ankyrin repeat domain-containing protein [Hydrogenophaga sp. BPS33]QHE84383.1 hypothetical protein F9K07_05505 [Hydrogenophaga sp. BPS33]
MKVFGAKFHPKTTSDTSFSTVQQQQDLLQQLGIDPTTSKAQALIEVHGHTLYLAFHGANAPLVIGSKDNGLVAIDTAPRRRGQAVDHPLPPLFGGLALALATAAPVHSLPLLTAALNCQARPATWKAVETAIEIATELGRHRSPATATPITTATATTTTTQTAHHTQTTRTTKTMPGATTTTTAMAATTTADPGPIGRAPLHAETTLSPQANAVQQANDEGPEKMVDAIMADDPKRVLAVLMLSPLLNGAIKGGATPLRLAARLGKLKVVDYLLKHPDIQRTAGKGGWTALQEAARGGHIHVVKRLLKDSHAGSATSLSTGATPFLTAIEHGHLKVANVLLNKERKVAKQLSNQPLSAGSWVGRPNAEGVTPLHMACRNGALETVQWLLAQPEILQHDGEVLDMETLLNLPAHDGKTPLLLAIGSGQAALVKYLLKQPGVKPEPENGAAAVLLAIRHDRLDMVELLQNKGANLHPVSKKDLTPLQFACLNGKLKAVKWLLEQPVAWQHKHPNRTVATVLNEPTRDGSTPLALATRSCNAQLVKFLLDQGSIDPNKANKKGNTPLHEGVNTRDVGIVRLLLTHTKTKVNLESLDGISPFFQAIKNNDLEMAKLLLKNGASIHQPTRSGDTPLRHACMNHLVEIVKWLLQQREVLQQNGRTLDRPTLLNQTPGGNDSLLMCAIGHGAEAELLVMYLLAQTGIDVNQGNGEGKTPLQMAAQRGLLVITQQLLAQSKIRVDAINASGSTAFHAAIAHGHLAVARLLMNKGADIRCTNKAGETSLHLACKSGSVDILRWLLEQLAHPKPHGQPSQLPALLNHPDKTGATPLHVAARLGPAEVVALLLSQNGIHLKPIDNTGRMPLHLAVHRGDSEVIELLDPPVKPMAQRLPADEEEV